MSSVDRVEKRLRAETMGIKTLVSGALAIVAIATPAPAPAQSNPYQRGPDPTVAGLQATQGPFATATLSVSDLSTPGFGSASVTYPTSTADGTFGAVAISPGYTASESSIAWLRPRLASQGSVQHQLAL
jgi:cutinase